MPEVWWVNHYAITPDQPGGTRHYDLATELAQRGFRVKVFASDVNLSTRKHTKLKDSELYKIEALDNIDFVWVRSCEYEANNWRRAWNMFSFAGNLTRVAPRLARQSRPDVVIGSSPHPFAALAAQRVARRVRARFALELRDLWPQALVDMGGVSEAHPGVRAMRALERHLYRNAELFIILARGSRDYLCSRGIAEERILYVPNGVHLGHFQADQDRQNTRKRLGFERFTLVYTGAHGPANSLETILHAGQLLQDEPVEFVLVGSGPSKEKLVAQAAAEKVRNVRFLDPVPKAEIPSLLAAADVGVITLKNAKAFAYGISPNKLFDYMAAQLPVICSVPGEMAAMVQEAQAGLTTVPEDAEALASAVRHLRSLPKHERDELGCNGRAFLTQHYRREVLADRLAEGLRLLTGINPATPVGV